MRRVICAVLFLSLTLTGGAVLALPDTPPGEQTPRFESVAALFTALDGDSTMIGQDVEVVSWVVADFYRDVFLFDGNVEGGGRGLRVTTGEHMAGVGERVIWRGTLAREGEETSLDARRGKLLTTDLAALAALYGARIPVEAASVPDPASGTLLTPLPHMIDAAELLADPARWLAWLVELRNGVITKIRRDGNGVPWLMIVEFGESEIDVPLYDGQQPVLREGDRIFILRGIWLKDRECWRLRIRNRDDYVLAAEVSPDLRTWPPERKVYRPARQLESKHGGTIGRKRQGRLLLDEICYNPAQAGEGEGAESFAVVNVGDRKMKLNGWSVTDNEGVWRFPDGVWLRAGAKLHVARDDERFFFEFGFMPDFSFDENPCPGDSSLIMNNIVDEILLLSPGGHVADALLFGSWTTQGQVGWEGIRVQPYQFNSFVPAEGQVFWRKRDLARGRRLDTDTAADWITDPHDPDLGRQLAFPGWDRELFLDTARCREKAEVTAFVSPDNCFAGLRDFIRAAERSLELEFYLITHPVIVDELLAAMDRGVLVHVLLNGEQFGARGGTYDSVRGLMTLIAEHESGLGRVWLWRNGDDPRHTGMDADIPDRYNHPHQKFIIADRARVLIGSDNLTQSSVPADLKINGTNGSRGVFLATDASCVVERLIEIWERDCDPERQRDVCQFISRDDLSERLPRAGSDRKGYDPVQPLPYSAREKAHFELSQSPDNCLRPDRAYLGLVNRAGEGDCVLVEQQYERPSWGYADRKTPNPRLAAYIEAARRGAMVRILVSGAGGEGRNVKNTFMRDMINAIADAEGLDLSAELGTLPEDRPGRDRPIHNKMLLARIGREYWSHVGSANGSETAHRMNREVGLSIESEGLFKYLAKVFAADWNSVEDATVVPVDW